MFARRSTIAFFLAALLGCGSDAPVADEVSSAEDCTADSAVATAPGLRRAPYEAFAAYRRQQFDLMQRMNAEDRWAPPLPSGVEVQLRFRDWFSAVGSGLFPYNDMAAMLVKPAAAIVDMGSGPGLFALDMLEITQTVNPSLEAYGFDLFHGYARDAIDQTLNGLTPPRFRQANLAAGPADSTYLFATRPQDRFVFRQNAFDYAIDLYGPIRYQVGHVAQQSSTAEQAARSSAGQTLMKMLENSQKLLKVGGELWVTGLSDFSEKTLLSELASFYGFKEERERSKLSSELRTLFKRDLDRFEAGDMTLSLDQRWVLGMMTEQIRQSATVVPEIAPRVSTASTSELLDLLRAHFNPNSTIIYSVIYKRER